MPSSHLSQRASSMADRLIKAEQQRKYVKELWLFLAVVIAILTLFRLLSFALTWVFKPNVLQAPPQKVSDSEKVGEVPEKGRSGKISWRNLPRAAASLFRTLAFRWTIPIGLSSVASVSELMFIIGYIVAMLVWILVDTRDLSTAFWEDRAAHLASSNLALVVALAGKNNVISSLTGIGTKSLSERTDLSHGWMRMGALGLVAFTLATLLSIRPIRHLAFEFFLVSHIVLIAIFLIGGVIHTREVGFDDYIWPALLVWGLDRFLRVSRLVWNSRVWGGLSRASSNAIVELLSEDTVRLTFRQKFNWRAGQHAYVILPTVSTLPTEAHPFTIASIPGNLDGSRSEKDREVVFLIRGRSGFTGRLREHAAKTGFCSVPAMIDGPYGCPPDLRPFSTCILIAGGSGVSYTLPLLMDVVRHANKGTSSTRRVVFVWAVRDPGHLSWISDVLTKALSAAPSWLEVEPRIYVTSSRLPISSLPTIEYRGSTSSVPTLQSPVKEKQQDLPNYNAFKITAGRPSIPRLLQDEVSQSTGAVSVDVAGPSAIAQSVRSALRSGITSPISVLKGAPSVVLHVETFGMVKG